MIASAREVGISERRHRLAAEIFADGGTHHRPPVGEARIRRLAGALELNVPEIAPVVARLADQQRPPVAQLARPDPELVSGIDHRQRRKTVQRAMTGKDLDKSGIGKSGGIEADQRRGLGIGMQQMWVFSHPLRRHRRIELARQARVMIFQLQAKRHRVT